MDNLDAVKTIVQIVAFIFSVIFHEIAHGFVAYRFGDDTAKISGRLSLNPLVHIDPIGSILVPGLLFLSGTNFLFGWAKPVPVNPYRLKGGVSAYRWVSLAGVLTNFVLAVIAALVIKITVQFLGFDFNNLGVILFVAFLQINIVLAVFNFLPLPGFDGFNFLTTFKPIAQVFSKSPLANPFFMARYGLVLSIAILFVFMPFINLIFNFIFNLFINFFGL
jgi:Zn-dependent protease